MSALKKNATAVVFICAGIISIGISAWQYQNNSGNALWYNSTTLQPLNWVTDVCNAFPYAYLRPFSVSVKNCPQCTIPSYCGYSQANTGYRVFIACATVVFGVLMIANLFEKRPKIFHYALLTCCIMWCASFVADSTSLSDATQACKNDVYMTNAICDGTSYGITIAVDVAMAAVSMAGFVLLGSFDEATGPVFNVN